MFKFIYQLIHEYIECYGEQNQPLYQTKDMGYFSSEKDAKEVIEKYKNLKGFKDHNVNCFKIKKKKLELEGIKLFDNKIIFYELYHAYRDKNGYIESDYLGVYPTKQKAKKKIKELIKNEKIYKQYPKGFDISEELLDSENTIWNEGFDNWDE